MRAHALLLLALAGCNTQIDPCAALAGKTCLAVRARGSLQIDQLELQGVIGVEIAAPARTPPVAAGAFDLPAVTAIDLGDFAGSFVIRVRGLRDSVEVGAGLAAGDLTRGQHKRVDVDLRAGEDAAVLDAAGLDLGKMDAAPPDLALDRDGGVPDGSGGDACTTCSGWRQIATVDGDLFGVWAASANDVFLVGEKAGTGGLVMHGREGSWSSGVLGSYRLNGIWGLTPDLVYAVSQGGEIWHFDGMSWLPSAPTGNSLYAITGTSPSRIYASGAQQILKVSAAQTNTWSSVFNVEVGWINNFYGAWAAPDGVFAVGYRYMPPSLGGGSVRSLAFNDWPIDFSPFDRLNGVWAASATDAFVVASTGEIWHRSTFGWEQETVAPEGLNAVWGDDVGNVYAVGDLGLIMYSDGSKRWTQESSPVSSRLRAVFGVDGVVYAVGDNGVVLRKP